MGFAILRITEAGNVIDSYFEANYKGCTANSIPVGVYKYSYAVNVSEIQYVGIRNRFFQNHVIRAFGKCRSGK